MALPSKQPMMSLVLDPLGSLIDALPKGRGLPEHIWTRRHNGLLVLLWLHVLGLGVMAFAQGYGVIHSTAEASLVALFGVAGSLRHANRRFRSIMVAFGLLTCSALVVHLTGGLIESHFHFFVIVPLLTLYADWPVFLLAIGFVTVHHGVFGLLETRAVFDHPEAWRAPWKWALIHAGYVLGACTAALCRGERMRNECYGMGSLSFPTPRLSSSKEIGRERAR